ERKAVRIMATHGNISRRGLLGGAAAVVAATATHTMSGTATATHTMSGTAAATHRALAPAESAALWREFTATPYTHPQIPFIGRAGYRAGSALPSRRSRKAAARGFVTDVVRDHGARPDGLADAAPAINRAIA
ncbi:hypothetical protein G3M55_92585, partial [Streptomyces sp. SID8455]|nr:hypothetical protein [Streptomyces sp. SID8455]